jgi:hypothetical protein
MARSVTRRGPTQAARPADAKKMTKGEAEKLLDVFLQNNPQSTIAEQDTPVGRQVIVKMPWNDETVAICVEAGDDPNIDALIHILLSDSGIRMSYLH